MIDRPRTPPRRRRWVVSLTDSYRAAGGSDLAAHQRSRRGTAGSLLIIVTTRLCGASRPAPPRPCTQCNTASSHRDDEFAGGHEGSGWLQIGPALERIGELLWNVPASREETAMDAETPYDLPSGERIWVSETALAAEHLSDLLKRFREGESQPLIFGDAGEPEGVVISWDEWSRLDALVGDVEGSGDAYETLLERTTDARSESSAPLGDAESEIGWDLNEDLDDSEPPKPPIL